MINIDQQIRDHKEALMTYLQGEQAESVIPPRTMTTALAYWRKQLAGVPPLLELPTDRPRPPVYSYRGASYLFSLDGALTIRLNQLAQRNDATLFMVLLSGFKLLLARYSRQTDIVVGTPIAGRNRAETEDLIGFFTNTLALRTQLDDNPSFHELLARVRESTLAAYEHQDLPFSQLVDELNLERSLSHSPLFQVMMVLQSAERRAQPTEVMESWTLSGVRATMQPADLPFAKFDLTLCLEEVDERLECKFEYNTDLFDEATISRMASHFTVLLEGIVNQPEQPIHQLPMLTDAEYHQIVHEWNNTTIDFGEPQTIHALFEQQVTRTPDAVALVFENQQLTYAELNARANQLAHHLIELGVQADTLVAVAMERSIDMVISLLAVLKAGGAYVPIDPTYPVQRIRYMLTDSAAPILLTQSHLGLSYDSGHVIAVDRYGAQLAARSRKNPSTQTSSKDLAYVIYTSGSSGKPKGVLVEHHNLVNFVQSALVEYGFTHQDRVLQFASISFDTAAEEIYPTLGCGATLVLRTDEMLSVPAFWKTCRKLELTVLDLPTAYWHQLASQLSTMIKNPLPSTLRLIIIGGERAIAEHLKRWQKYIEQKPKLLNTYGPTEGTIVATSYNLSDHKVVLGRELPIGRPLSNIQVYILDQFLQPVSIGIPGELHIGGAGLARGYLNRPKLTAERFINHPEFGRLYKTGDLCRWLLDGNACADAGSIEFIGRTDFQVKIRGFRIELGEIENALLAHETVREAVVLAREEGVSGDKRLVAYLVPKGCSAIGDGEIDPSLLREYLSLRLPAYMVPAAFVMLSAWPLTPNGKLDRNALPAPNYADARTEFVAPRNALEEQLAAIWREVLHIDEVGVHDNFFALGGHSLLATQIISRLRSQLNVEVPLKLLFEAPELATFAQHLHQLSNETAIPVMDAAILPLERDGASRFPLSFAQQRLWFLNQLEPESAFYNIPLLIRLEGDLDLVALSESFTYLIARHESLRTTFSTTTDDENGTPMQVIHAPAAVTLPVIPVADEREAHQRAQIEVTTPFDLSTAPLLRVQLLKLAETDHLLLLTMHHIISDGWSMDVLMKELSHVYTAYAPRGGVQETAPIPHASGHALPNLPIQYADFAVWQRNTLSDERLERQLSYWREQLIGAPALLELPTDRPRPPVQSYRGAHYLFTLKKELALRLQDLSLASGATLFMTMLAAFKVLLMRYSGQEDVVIGSPMANRNHLEIEPLIGFFANTLVLRSDLSGNPTFKELLAQIKSTTLDAYRHQDAPFEKVVERLQPERDLSYSPLFQVMFNVLQNSFSTIKLPGLTIERVDSAYPMAKFDLMLLVEESVLDKSLACFIEYSTDLFDQSTIVRMATHFQTLLQAIVDHPAQPISSYPLLTSQELHQLLIEWNATASDYPKSQGIHNLFEEHAAAERTPDAVAVLFSNKQLTYRELNERANQLAHYLIRQGVRPNERVGICVERSLEMIIGLLAILKAGGTYLPLDPSYPRERLHLMLSDAEVKVLLTNEQNRVKLPATTARLVNMATIYTMPTSNPTLVCAPADLAYVLYTSGSTGQPKGVAVPHRTLCNLIPWQAQESHAPTRTLQFSPMNFDVSLQEIFSTLCVGATLVLVSQEIRRDPFALLDYLREQAITRLFLPFIALQQLAEVANGQMPPTLREVITAGEQLQITSAIRAWFEGSQCTLTNQYGPTESHVVTAYRLADEVSEWPSLPPIGRPITNTQLYILDAHQQPVPIGVAGELYIGGDSLAQGYLNRSQLTREKFVSNPFGEGKLYKTGDLCRYLPTPDNGFPKIEFLKRIDHQVKIRGFRIEVGEIESALNSEPNVREAVVIVHQDNRKSAHSTQHANKRLVAFIVGDAAGLRDKLRQQLPDYMIPSAFVELEALPLTTSGKIDRRALAEGALGQELFELMSEESFIPPSSPTEMALTAIWSKVLGIKQASPEHSRRIGIQHNFFDLGGHSLLATQVISRINTDFQLNMSVRTLFEHPTIKVLSEQVQLLLEAKEMAAQTLLAVDQSDTEEETEIEEW